MDCSPEKNSRRKKPSPTAEASSADSSVRRITTNLASLRGSLALALGLVLFACDSREGDQALVDVESEAVASGSTRVVSLEELQTALESYRGRAVLLNFWATWCEPCVRELPDLAEVHQAFREKGGVVVGVSYDLMIPGPTPESALKLVEQFAAGRELGFDNYIFEDDDYDRINAWLELPGPVPVTLAIDAAGKVVDRHEGQAGRERFEAMMHTALGS